MRTMQEFILNEIDDIAQRYELNATIDKSFSNSGTLYIMDRLDHVLIINFNFQDGNCSLEVNNQYDKKLAHMSNGYLEYKNTKELKKFLSHIDSYLRENDMEGNL